MNITKLFAHTIASIAIVTIAVGCTPADKNSVVNSQNTPSIIGGNNVPEGASLQKSIVGIFDMKKGALCTGSLIDSNIVLTAAHCIGEAPEDLLVIFYTDLDAIFKSTDKNFILQKVRRGEKTVVNPDWGKKKSSPRTAWGDTALIKFEGTAPNGFTPATILTSADQLTEGATITVAGYGVNSDVLTEVKKEDTPEFKEQELKNQIFCEKSDDGTTGKCYKEEVSGEGLLRTTELTVMGNFNETEIAFDQQHGHASCEGDSGGPAYVKQANGEYQLFGVTSRGTRGCDGVILYSNIASDQLNAWLKDAKSQLQ